MANPNYGTLKQKLNIFLIIMGIFIIESFTLTPIIEYERSTLLLINHSNRTNSIIMLIRAIFMNLMYLFCKP